MSRKPAPTAATFESLLALDAELVRASQGTIPPLTAFWRAQLQRLYTHPTARTLVGRVGRGGAKSHTSAKVALNETLYGDWRIPAGEVHYYAFVSLSKDEAAQRLRVLQEFLRALKIPFDVAGETITLRGRPRGFKVLACQVGAVSGFRCFGYSADELAKWTAGTEYANPASEVCASLSAMTITHPDSRRLLISSPFGVTDMHALAFDQGDTDHQIVCHAASWVANPDGITEATARAKETDPGVFAREYEAIPSASVSSAFEPDDIAACFGRVSRSQLGHGWVSLDPSSLRADGFGFACGRVSHVGEVVVEQCGEFPPTMLLRDVVTKIAEMARRVRANDVFSDQRERAGLTELLAERRLNLISLAWSDTSKTEAILTMRRWMRDHRLIVLPTCEGAERLRIELLRCKARPLPSGRVSYNTGGLDVASCLVSLATAADKEHFKIDNVSALERVNWNNPNITNLLAQLGEQACDGLTGQQRRRMGF